ncbi:MAG: DNA repair protein RecN, partial [Alphaproteobacteria bacterium]|nr:DNA repair protein RecN [Alphaproteobacteria bacterium]
RLAHDTQVIVVTHSPQVAARAGHHWRILKQTKGSDVRTTVEDLDPDRRREEIARMLAGAKVTDEARAAADSLLQAAGT